jgi:hypothetical protein
MYTAIILDGTDRMESLPQHPPMKRFWTDAVLSLALLSIWRLVFHRAELRVAENI